MRKIIRCLIILMVLSVNTSVFAWDLTDISSKNVGTIDFSKDQAYFNISKIDVVVKNGWEGIVGDTTGLLNNSTGITNDNVTGNNNEKVIWEVTQWGNEFILPTIFPKLRFSLIEEKISKAIGGILVEITNELISVYKSSFIKYKPTIVTRFYRLTVPGSGWFGWGGGNAILTDAITDYNRSLSDRVLQRVWNSPSNSLQEDNQVSNYLETKNRLVCNFWYRYVDGKCIPVDLTVEISDTSNSITDNNGGNIPNNIPNIPKLNSNFSTDTIKIQVDPCLQTSSYYDANRCNINKTIQNLKNYDFLY